MPGPWNLRGGQVPKVPGPGCENAAGFIRNPVVVYRLGSVVAPTNVEIGITHFGRIIVSVLREWPGRQVVAKIGEPVTKRVAQGVAQSLGHPPSQGEFEGVVVSISVVGGVLQEGMLAARFATGTGKRGDVGDRVQVGKRELQNWAAIVEAGYASLVEVTQPVHLTAPISNICCPRHCVTRYLYLCAETRLLDVTRALVRILGA